MLFVLTGLDSLSFVIVRVPEAAALLSVILLIAILVLVFSNLTDVAVVLFALRPSFVVSTVRSLPELKPSFISLSSVFSVLVSLRGAGLLGLLDGLVRLARGLGVGVQGLLRLKRVLAVLREIGVDLGLLLVLTSALRSSLLIHIR